MSPIASFRKSGRRVGAYIKIAFGIRNANALLLKQSPDLVKNLAFDVVDAILGILNPEPQLELYRGLAKAHDPCVRRRHSQHTPPTTTRSAYHNSTRANYRAH